MLKLTTFFAIITALSTATTAAAYETSGHICDTQGGAIAVLAALKEAPLDNLDMSNISGVTSAIANNGCSDILDVSVNPDGVELHRHERVDVSFGIATIHGKYVVFEYHGGT